MNDHAVIERFCSAMRDQGIVTKDEIVGDGNLYRVHVEGDRPGSRNGWYVLFDDDRPAGKFGCNKRYGEKQFSWADKGRVTTLSVREKQELNARIEQRKVERKQKEEKRHADAATRARQIWESARSCTEHPYLARKMVESYDLRVGPWELIDQETGAVTQVCENALLVPVHGIRKQDILSLQAIFPDANNILHRDKDFLKDGAKRGYFCSIGKPLSHEGRTVFILAEGYATAATVFAATGHYCLVCFDTSNLVHVARIVRERQPEAIIVLAADHDQWTTKPIPNPGVHFAKAAAREVNGLVAVPAFADITTKPTDFNDLLVLEGLDAVRGQILSVLEKADYAFAHEEKSLDTDMQTPPAYATEEPVAFEETALELPESKPKKTPLSHTIKSTGFTMLGYDGKDGYFYYSHRKMQVVRFRKSDLTDLGLIEMADANWWESHFPNSRGGIDKKAAGQWLFSLAHSKGLYDLRRARGRGAWRDDGRIVFHHGNYLTVDGKRMELPEIRSSYVYIINLSRVLPEAKPMSDEDGRHLLSVAEMVRWSRPGSAALMAGWTFLAPICGALKWRPHIWITGAAGSGKSTIQRDFCGGLIGEAALYAQGNSTEPGIRQELKGDSLPVLIDEVESNKLNDINRVDNLLMMMRQASSESEASTYKGTVAGESIRYQVRSMFCLASINTNLGNRADADRLTPLVIRKPSAETDNWSQLKEELYRLSSNSAISCRFLARSLSMIPVITETIEVFRKVAAKIFESQRTGDQFGTLLAGCWCMFHRHVATEKEAVAFINKYEWDEHTDNLKEDESETALSWLLNAKVRVGGSSPDLSIYELVQEAHPAFRVGVVDQEAADALLRRHGFRLKQYDGVLLIAPQVPNLIDLVKDTRFSTDIRGQLLRVPGATNNGNRPERFMGKSCKAVSIPLKLILGENKPELPSSVDKIF